MKLRFLLPLAVSLVIPAAAGAYEIGDIVALSPELNGKVMSKNGTNHKVEVSANPDNKPSGTLVIKNMYTVGGDTFTVTMIAADAFSSCDLKTVTVGVDMYLVGSRAFRGCTKLTGFFETQRGSVTVIGEDAFGFTKSMIEATFPGVVRVGDFAFRRSGIASVEMTAVKELGAGVFQECENLTTFAGGENLVSVGNIAFCHCPKFTGLTLGPSLTKVGATSFAFGLDLKNMVVPCSQTEAGHNAYQGCGLERVFILSESVMDFVDASALLRNKSISKVYCVNSVREAVADYLTTGTNDTPVSMLTEAVPESVDNVLEMKPTDVEDIYEAELKIEGITGLQVFDAETGDEILPVNNQYSITGDKVRLRYYVDSINLLDYVTTVDDMISGINKIDVNTHAAEYYTLDGMRVDTPSCGIYICRYNDGRAIKVRF